MNIKYLRVIVSCTCTVISGFKYMDVKLFLLNLCLGCQSLVKSSKSIWNDKQNVEWISTKWNVCTLFPTVFCLLPCILLSVLKVLLTRGFWMPRLRCTLLCQFFSHNQINKWITIKINSRTTRISYLRKYDYVLLLSLLPKSNSPHLLRKNIVWYANCMMVIDMTGNVFPSTNIKTIKYSGEKGRFCYSLFFYQIDFTVTSKFTEKL